MPEFIQYPTGGEKKPIHTPIFAAYGTIKDGMHGFDFVAADLVPAKGDPIIGIPLLHPVHGLHHYSKPFWVIKFHCPKDLDCKQPYTLNLIEATTRKVIESVGHIYFASAFQADVGITYPKSTDSPCKSFPATGTAIPGGTPTGALFQNGEKKKDGTNPQGGMNWTLYFIDVTPGVYDLIVGVPGSGGDTKKGITVRDC
jgi:hypothetical protein